jgi:para-aminobenzoate synthetase component 1
MERLTRTGKITGIHCEAIELQEPFIDVANRFADVPGTVCLLSGGDLDCARYHILGTRPFLIFKGRGRTMELSDGEGADRFSADPLDTLRQILRHFETPEIQWPVPFPAGLLGYLAYDLKDAIENLPRTSVDDLELPSIWFSAPSLVLVHDRQEDHTTLYVPVRENQEPRHTGETLIWFNNRLAGEPPEDAGFSGDGSGFRSNFDKASYMEAIDRIREYIKAGDIYQVNMSQRFQMGFHGDPFSLFKTLFRRNPAPFFAFIHAGDHHIVSTSPERFILKTGGHVETRPIKGTRPRGKTPEEDAALKAELVHSKKDDAELSMIVDLMRNDLGKVCKGGGVKVTEHKRVEAYTNVFHLISIVDGELDQGKDAVDIIRATFPGGSITGCPKIRSMEIIDELETRRRHLYTGSIGYIGFGGTMDLSIAIRTATILNGRMVFSVGGGVVFDSDPLDEYNETLHKGRTLFDAFGGANGEKNAPAMFAWMNGGLKPLDELALPLDSQGAQYGHGFFETVRVDRGKIYFLDDHLHRLAASFSAFFPGTFPDLTFGDIIRQVIAANGLEDRVAAVKIMVARGKRDHAPFDHNVAVLARPYTHRLTALNKDGIDLGICENPRHTPVAAHKSMNYQFYLQAGERARANGFDESLILNMDGSVSETNTANILFVKDKTLVLPVSDHALQGVMEKNVRTLLASWGYEVRRLKVYPLGMGEWDSVFLTNSLMGAVPVRTFEGKKLKDSSGLCAEINARLLESP